MKKTVASLFIVVLVLAGCAPDFGEEQEEAIIDENIDDSLQDTAIIPKYNLDEENYRVLIDSNLSQARGVITNQVANRLDIDELEEGLRRHSMEVYDPDTYYFQEGQYLTDDILYNWLSRYDEEDQPSGLNPELEKEGKEGEKDNPKYLSHILEQDYLRKTDDDSVELAGISIGIAMKSVYRFRTQLEDGTYSPYYEEEISKKDMMSEANDIAEKIVQRIREMEGLENVPIMLAIFREEEQNSLVPGNFVAKTNVAGDSSSVGDWKEVNEENVMFPSDYGKSTYPDIGATLVDFEADIGSYFPNYVSVIGKGFFQNGELRELTVEIPVSFYGKAELIGFTQYVYGLVLSGFPNTYQLEVNITSGEKQEALIIRDAGEEEGTVHIYR
ncbi:Protein involved in sex pheromone biosynthesis [Gracilibacillus orientalis]|uniref:Protein involved in sex pheromone biosynthesis n=1 Tax=Gracilibacillus orientalis TaxID=334253 RepID=A0A1I4N8G8_9BACI|nr:CamS family sex pheromone protein [Gracilibacillus orientalis]SFM11778.1 Protein involved in sex pheromone biosynthesis [Gracilibacillus orientalis]